MASALPADVDRPPPLVPAGGVVVVDVAARRRPATWLPVVGLEVAQPRADHRRTMPATAMADRQADVAWLTVRRPGCEQQSVRGGVCGVVLVVLPRSRSSAHASAAHVAKYDVICSRDGRSDGDAEAGARAR